MGHFAETACGGSGHDWTWPADRRIFVLPESCPNPRSTDAVREVLRAAPDRWFRSREIVARLTLPTRAVTAGLMTLLAQGVVERCVIDPTIRTPKHNRAYRWCVEGRVA